MKEDSQLISLSAPSPSPGSLSSLDREVLEEEEYLGMMDSIIKRDFFPELPWQTLRLRYLQAIRDKDYDSLFKVKEEFHRLHKKAKEEEEEEGEEKNGLPRLDLFHQTHQSEDNHSFSEMKRIEQEKNKETQWMYQIEQTAKQQLSLQQTASSDASSKQIGWKFKTENQLMFVPNGIEPSEKEEKERRAPPKQLILKNIRFPGSYIPTSLSEGTKPKRKNTKNANAAPLASLPLLFGREDRDSNKKIDLDSLHDAVYAKMRNSPPKGDYDYLGTPEIQPGEAGEGKQGNSFITWGTLGSTPLLVSDSGSPHSGYQLPPTPVRDKVAQELTNKASKSLKGKKAKTKKLASQSVGYFRSSPRHSPLSPLSPLQKQFLHKHTPIRTSRFGSQLSKSYSSPHSRVGTPGTPLTPRGGTPITPQVIPKRK